MNYEYSNKMEEKQEEPSSSMGNIRINLDLNNMNFNK